MTHITACPATPARSRPSGEKARDRPAVHPAKSLAGFAAGNRNTRRRSASTPPGFSPSESLTAAGGAGDGTSVHSSMWNSLLTARYLPSGEKATPRKDLRWSDSISVPVATSHKRTVSSPPEVASHLRSGENATALHEPVSSGVRRLIFSRPVSTSQILKSLSMPLLATWRPSGETEKLRIPLQDHKLDRPCPA